MVDYKTAMRVFRSSKRFEFSDTVLTIWDYYNSNNKVVIDFANMTPEILSELTAAQNASIYYNEDDDMWEVWDEEGNEMWETFCTEDGAIEYCKERGMEYIYA